MRGKSELVKADKGDQPNSGLECSYITQWSYGIGETWTLLIPNAKGGSHGDQLGKHENSMAKCDDPQLREFLAQWFPYWGDQPFTAGPVYVGAFVLMLFILGLFIVKGPMKWALLAATVLSIMLSWGKNFMGLTDFFLDYVPMYAKFRTVASILVIAEFTIPLLAMLALKELFSEKDDHRRSIRFIWISFALTGGIALLFAVLPDMFFGNYISSSEMHAMSQIPADQLQPLLQNLTEMRRAMFTSDAWRSFIIIAIGTGCLLFYCIRKKGEVAVTVVLLLLCLFDLW